MGSLYYVFHKYVNMKIVDKTHVLFLIIHLDDGWSQMSLRF